MTFDGTTLSVTGNTSVNGNSTADTFGNGELYIPNYASSLNKQISEFGVNENNSSTASLNIGATYWRNTAVINTIIFYPYNSSNFVAGSSFYLYGISNA
jgi:hypothetical protein